MRHEKMERLRVLVAAAAERAFPSLAGLVPEFELPRDPEHGDLASNFAMRVTRQAGSPPREVARRVVAALDPAPDLVERVEVEGPGFINFTWSPACLRDELAAMLRSGDAYGRWEGAPRGRVQVEFVSANPTGPLNVVSARAAAVGDSLCRLFRMAGYRCEAEFYVNDAGSQVVALANSVEAHLRHRAWGEPLPEELPYQGHYVGELAQELLGLAQAIASLPAGRRAQETARVTRLYESDDPPPASRLAQELGAGELRGDVAAGVREFLDHFDFGRFAVAEILRGQREDLARFGVEFDADTGRGARGWFRESWLHREGAPEEALRALGDAGHVEEKDEALWLATGRHGDTEDRVIRRRTGEYTYFLADIAYHRDKRRRGYDRAIDIWGPDHHGHVARMQAALRMQGYPEDWLTVLIAQQVNLLRGGEPVKMSKRAGEFVTLGELVEEVGRDVARFFFLMRRTSSPLDFDLDLARKESDENPIFYIEYAYARIRSIFEVTRSRGEDPETRLRRADLSCLGEPEELRLMKMLARFPAVVEGAVRVLDPQVVGNFLRELAQAYHRYYHRVRVLVDEPELVAARLALAQAVRVVLGNGLRSIGVEPPQERM